MMTAIITTFMPFFEEIMTVFCIDNMTQYGMTLHYPTGNVHYQWGNYNTPMSEGATAKSLEGMVIGMGFTIGIPSISQWRVSQRVNVNVNVNWGWFSFESQ